MEAIRNQIAAARAVAPMVSKAVTAVYQANNWSTVVSGTNDAYFEAGNWELAAGRMFNEAEERAGKAVCVIGETVRNELFGGQNPVGSEIRIKQFACEVIGLLAAQGPVGHGLGPGRHGGHAAAHRAAAPERQPGRQPAARRGARPAPRSTRPRTRSRC